MKISTEEKTITYGWWQRQTVGQWPALFSLYRWVYHRQDQTWGL